MQQGLFRRAALERLSSPERLDELMEVTPPRIWLALLALLGLLAAALLWAMFGSVPTLVRGEGVLIREGSVRTIEAPVAGELETLTVRAGDVVQAGQALARIVEPSSRQVTTVTSPYAGRVLEVRATPGDQVLSGGGLLTVERPEGQLEAVLYLSPGEATTVQPGMEVQIAPASVKREEYGLLLGRIRTVGAFPASRAAMRQALGSDELAERFAAGGPATEVRVELVPSATTPSGYQWTSTVGAGGLSGSIFAGRGRVAGAPSAPANGTPCLADVVTDQEPPISLVLASAGR